MVIIKDKLKIKVLENNNEVRRDKSFESTLFLFVIFKSFFRS